MAGTPSAALVTLALPSDFDPGFVEAVYAGMNALANRYEVAIVGGETTTNPERMLISISVLGTVAKGKCALRSGALAGDAIFVTGELGGSLSGKHLEFEPRLAEARWLAENFSLHAMIDISDGLAGDLRHLLQASRVGAELLSSAIPISHAARSRRGEAAGTQPGHEPTPDPSQEGNNNRTRSVLLPSSEGAGGGSAESASQAGAGSFLPGAAGYKPPLLAALTDGEDFELLFTVASKDSVPLLDAWKKSFPELLLSCIGKVISGEGITIRDKEDARPLTAHGYTHFA